MLNIVLFGPPGSGKGTQSANLVKKYGVLQLSTGDLLRAEIEEKTALGLQAKTLMDSGQLVPDEVVIGIIGNQLNNRPNAKGFIFDGFPRTVGQAEALDALLAKKGMSINIMLALKVPDNELIERLLLRGKESDRPDDQNEEVVKGRIEVYNQKTLPVANYYNAQGKYTDINGVGKIADVFEALCNKIDSL